MSKITLGTVGSIPQNPVTAQTVINSNFATIQTAFDNTLSRDGTTPDQMTANLDMNSNRLLNLPAPVNASEALRLKDLSSFVGGGTVTNIPAGGTTGQALTKTSNTDYQVGWSSPGTVTSVGLALPSDFTVTNSPVTTTGNLTGAWTTTPTGTGAVVRATSPTLTSPTLVTPALGTPTSGVATNLTGTAAGLTAGTVTTNANLTGPITSSGNATAVAAQTGTGSTFVMQTAPTLVTPAIGVATGTSLQIGPTDLLPVITNKVEASSSSAISTVAAGQDTTHSIQLQWNWNATPANAIGVLATTGYNNPLQIDGSAVTIGSNAGCAVAIHGTNTSDNAAAAMVGEHIVSTVASGAPIGLTNGTAANLTSISLTAGDWEVEMEPVFTIGATTNVTELIGSISTASATLNQTPFGTAYMCFPGVVLGNVNQSCPGVKTRLSLASTTTVFAVVEAFFSVSTCSCWGGIRARRVR